MTPAEVPHKSRSLLRTVIAHELRLHAASRGRLSLTLLMFGLALLATVRGAQRFHDRASATAAAAAAGEAAWQGASPERWLDVAARAGRWVYLPARAESALMDGLADSQDPGLRVRAGVAAPHRLDLADGFASWAPRAPGFGALDLGFVLLVLAPLWALILCFDAICGEKAQGTLRAVFSRPVPRRRHLLARMAATSLIVLVPLVTAVLLGLALATGLGHFDSASIPVVRLTLFLVVAGVHLLVYVGLGFWLSSVTVDQRASLAASVAVWAACVFFVPRLALLVADQVRPLPSRVAVEIAKRQALTDARRAVLEEQQAEGSWMAERIVVGERALDRELALEAAWRARRGEARRLGMRLASVSPMALSAFALMQISSTDAERYDRFVASADEYRQRFTRHFAGYVRGQSRGNALASAPEPLFVEQAGRDLLRDVLPALAWLAFLATAALLAAIRAFDRYDLR